MGNSFNKEQRHQFKFLIDSILNNNYPILDIGNNMGDTDYLDFIKYEDTSSPVMKGRDKYNRPFFVIRGQILCSDGNTINSG